MHATHRSLPGGGVSTLVPDGGDVMAARMAHSCMNTPGCEMTSALSSATTHQAPPQPAQTIYTCHAQNYVTEPRLSDWDPIVTRPDGAPVPYSSTSPCP